MFPFCLLSIDLENHFCCFAYTQQPAIKRRRRTERTTQSIARLYKWNPKMKRTPMLAHFFFAVYCHIHEYSLFVHVCIFDENTTKYKLNDSTWMHLPQRINEEERYLHCTAHSDRNNNTYTVHNSFIGLAKHRIRDGATFSTWATIVCELFAMFRLFVAIIISEQSEPRKSGRSCRCPCAVSCVYGTIVGGVSMYSVLLFNSV